jgi:hypothetical protein
MLLFVLQRANSLTKDCMNVPEGYTRLSNRTNVNILPENRRIISVSSLIFIDKICQILSFGSFGFGFGIGFGFGSFGFGNFFLPVLVLVLVLVEKSVLRQH